MKAKAIVLAITGMLAVSGIAAPARAQTEQATSNQHKCNPTGASYPGYVGPYAYAPYYYGHLPDCGGSRFYLAPTFYGYGYPEYRVPGQTKRGAKLSW